MGVLRLGLGGGLVFSALGNVTEPVWPPHCSSVGGDQHGWPVFNSNSELQADTAWSNYFNTVYGEIPQTGYPICTFDFKIMYQDALASAGIPAKITTHCTEVGTLSEFWALFAGYDDWFYFMYHGWTTSPHNPAAPSNVWVEVVHAISLDERDGSWWFHMPGSGVWIFTGNTAAFDSHQGTWDGIMGPGNDCESRTPKFSCGDVLFKTAKEKLGLDTVQITMGSDCAEGLQIVDTVGYGADACGRSNLRSGWEASSACHCSNEYRACNCAEMGTLPQPALSSCPTSAKTLAGRALRGGQPIPKQRSWDEAECCKVCASTEGCTYWNFNPNDGSDDHRCHMFSGTPTSVDTVESIEGFVSGINSGGSCSGVRECHRQSTGAIIPKQKAETPDECCLICTLTSDCSSWIYNPGNTDGYHCHMFSGAISTTRCENDVAGMSGGYVPERLVNTCAGNRECHRSSGSPIPKQIAATPDDCCVICTNILECSSWIWNPGNTDGYHCHMFNGGITSERCEDSVPGMRGGYIPDRSGFVVQEGVLNKTALLV